LLLSKRKLPSRAIHEIIKIILLTQIRSIHRLCTINSNEKRAGWGMLLMLLLFVGGIGVGGGSVGQTEIIFGNL